MSLGDPSADLAPPASPADLAAPVHVWWIDLDKCASALGDLRRLLSPEEADRAGRFRAEADRRRYAVCHGALRCVLGAYAGLEPAALRFETGEWGKPRLAGGGDGRVSFNLSHSEHVAVVAVTRDREVGVDVERVRVVEELESVARHYFSPGEVEELFRLPPAVRGEAFFACWARKEAVLKARGTGLSCPLDSFDVTVVPSIPPRLLRLTGDDPDRWSILDLAAGPSFAAAIVVTGPPPRVRATVWTPHRGVTVDDARDLFEPVEATNS